MLLTASCVFVDGRFERDFGVRVGQDGRILEVGPLQELGKPDRVLEGRALLPGAVNAHSHAFQRLLRGRTQRAREDCEDDFWSWRDAMFRVASVLDPEQTFILQVRDPESAAVGTTDDGYGYVIMPLAREQKP